MDQDIKFVKNQSGRYTLLCGGYSYNKHITNKSKSEKWRCVKRKECSATITIDKTRRRILRKSQHTCVTNNASNIVRKHIANMKKEVCTDFGSIRTIFNNEIEKLKKKVHTCDLPSFKSVKDSLYRARKKFLNTFRLNHDSPATVKIPERLAKSFFVCEDGDTEKILVFATKLSRKIIKKSGFYYGDGTFKVTPRPFYQLYTLHYDLNSNSKSTNIIPVVYALLPNKTQATYERLFRILNEKLGIEITDFKSDYEIAQSNAVLSVFPNAKVTGCYRHYNTAIWKQSKKLKLTETKEGRNTTRLCAIMPLVPATQIPEAWRNILDSAPGTQIMQRFQHYYENQWYPKLPPTMLSCAGQRHRTTNALEGWHRRLNILIEKKPNLYLFIYKLTKEARHWDIQIKNSLFGNYRLNRKDKDISFDKKYNKLLTKLNCNAIDLQEFMKKITFLQLVK